MIFFSYSTLSNM